MISLGESTIAHLEDDKIRWRGVKELVWSYTQYLAKLMLKSPFSYFKSLFSFFFFLNLKQLYQSILVVT